MHIHDIQQNTRKHTPINTEDNELIATSSPTQVQRIMHLQRTIGNTAVQRLIAQGQIQIPSVTKAPESSIHRKGCGCAACCGVQEDSEQDTQSELVEAKVQRAGADDEDNDDSGGGWLSDTVSGIADTVGGWFGGDDDNEDGELKSIPQITAKCKTDEAIGYGNGEGGSVNLHGVTTADYNAGEPMPEPFPDTVNVETFKAGNQDGFTANGHFEATFDARTNVTLPDVPAGLSECQTEAVQNFIDGPLTAHENDHVSAFRDNYDGTVQIQVSTGRLLDTPDNRRNSMQNPLAVEHNRRRELANDASDALDPWNQDIPGLDCEDE